MYKIVFAILLFMSFFTQCLFAQLKGEEIASLTGENSSDQFGRFIATAGDVNGDGTDDLIVGAFLYSTRAGSAYIFLGSSSFSGNLDANQANVILTGENSNDHFGCSVSTAGDVNGDGFDDVIVGAQDNDAGGLNAGRAYIFFGGPSFSGNFNASQANVILTDRYSEDYFGGSVSTAGDVNGDGFDDVIVGAFRNDAGGWGAGRAYIFFGGPSFSGNFNARQANVILTGENSNDEFGISVSTAGDLNNDGIDDVIVGAHYNNAGGFDAGRAYVFFGGLSFSGIYDASQANVILTGENSDDRFGNSVSTAGDLNDDGTDDLIVGAHYNNAGGANAGRAYVFFGGLSFSGIYDASQANVILTGENSNDEFGTAISTAGDLNHDNIDDIIIGAPYNASGVTNSGRAYVFLGGLSFSGNFNARQANVILTGENSND